MVLEAGKSKSQGSHLVLHPKVAQSIHGGEHTDPVIVHIDS